MFELQCADSVKELWHDVCKAIIIERLRLSNISKVRMYICIMQIYKRGCM